MGTLDNSHQPTNGLHDVLVEKDWIRGTLEAWSIQWIQSVHLECDALQMLKWHWHKMNPKERRANLSNESNSIWYQQTLCVLNWGAMQSSFTEFYSVSGWLQIFVSCANFQVTCNFASILVSRVGSSFSRHNKMNDWLTDNRNYMTFQTHFRTKAAPNKIRRFPPERALELPRFRPDHAHLAWALSDCALWGENWHPSPKTCHRLLSV